MSENQSLSGLTSKLLSRIDVYLDQEKPDLVLAQGDTTTVFTTALACFYKKIPFGHVEAGLRTYDMSAPWPEEANRVLTTQISALHFAPTQNASDNLLKEGVQEKNVFVTGNTVVDALQSVVPRLCEYEEVVQSVIPGVVINSDKKTVLITGHRRENFDGGLKRVCESVQLLAEKFPDVQFVYPVHLNPVVQKEVNETLKKEQKNIHIIKPLTYIPFVWLMNRASFIITDSGGIQEEAPSLGKPVLVTREVTERPEGVDAGNTLLVGTDTDVIVGAAVRLLTDVKFYDSMAHATNPYGDGSAANEIIRICTKYLYEQN
jgi:UDP-N-acetylglucosamine 2-epimerase (non-hydrolysing)